MNASTNRKHNRFQQRWIGVWHGKKRRRLLEGGGDAAIAARYLIPFSARLSKHRIKRLEHVRRAKTGYTRGSVTNAGRYKIISLLVTGHGDPPFVGWNTVERACVCFLYLSLCSGYLWRSYASPRTNLFPRKILMRWQSHCLWHTFPIEQFEFIRTSKLESIG